MDKDIKPLKLDRQTISKADRLRYKVPQTTISYSNFNGHLILSSIDLDLKTISNWESLPFLLNKLLPLTCEDSDELKEAIELRDKKNRRLYG